MSPINWSRIHERRSISPTTLPLALFSYLYGLGVRLRLTAYQRKKRRSLPGFVVSIGNLTVGGTGKTPAACMLAQWALDEGYRVAILSRGYGGWHKGKVLEVSDGNQVNAGPLEAGDEPYLLAKKLPGVPVVVAPKRYLGGQFAHNKFRTNFFILDDGFQHLSLKRDLDLVLLDASNPFGNGYLLPRGPLREPVTELKRADSLVITRSGPDGSIDELIDDLKNRFPSKPIFRSDHLPEKIVIPSRRLVKNVDLINSMDIMGFAGIARPDVFMKTLTELGAELVFFKVFRDHHSYQSREIQELMTEKRRLKADYLVTTEKDWVRMENFVPAYPDLAYLTIKFSLLDDREKFFRMVEEKVERFRISEG
ncbi:MAG: tetraacyldisaccharide 4'-kinase [Desulfobacteraceae bacterium]|jgi:tetraacyldisaccharide 4'-kinase